MKLLVEKKCISCLCVYEFIQFKTMKSFPINDNRIGLHLVGHKVNIHKIIKELMVCT